MPTPSSISLVALATVLLTLPAGAQAPTPPPADAVAHQIDIGAQWFRARCAECHEKGDLNNANFQVKWSGQSAFDLYEIIQRTMPEDEPGGLTPGTYTAITAYLMKLNGMPASLAVLSSDSTALRTVKLSFARAAATTPR